MLVRNNTAVRQLDSLSGTLLEAAPLNEWVDVPYEVAMRLWRFRVVDVQNPGDMKNALFKEADGTHIFWASPFSLGDGYGTAASQLVLAATRAGMHMHIAWTWFHSLYGVDPQIKSMLAETLPGPLKVGVCMATPGEFRKLPTPFKVGYTMYESDDPLKNLPEWRHDMTAIDLLLVPSEYCKEVFAPFTPCPIEVVPLVANPAYRVQPGERTRKPGQTFVFGIHGTLTERKSPLEIAEAFRKAFPTEKDVQLQFKTRLGVLGAGQDQIPALGDRRIKVIDENWLEARLRNWLVNTVDCFLFLTKGEGFGMPPREAMLAGCPLIFSNHTGMVDMANPAVNWPIGWEAKENSPLGGTWRMPDWDEAVKAMRWVYEHRDEAQAKGFAGAEWYEATHGPVPVAARFAQVINAIDPSKTHREPIKPAETIDTLTGAEHDSFYQALTLAIPPGSTVADVGVGGDGILYKWLVGHGYKVVGIVEKGREAGVRAALEKHGLPVNLDVVTRLVDLHLLRLGVDAYVSQNVLQDYQRHEVELILRSCLIGNKPVWFSVPTVYFPTPFGPGAKLRRRANWEDILIDFEFEMHYYGSGHRYLWARVVRLEEGFRASFEATGRQRGLTTDGVWHPQAERQADGMVTRGDRDAA